MARDFPGSATNYLDGGDVAAVDITGSLLTISAWIKPDIVNADQGIVFKCNNTATAVQYFLRLKNDAALRIAVGDGGSGIEFADGGAVVAGRWQHVVGVKNGAAGLFGYIGGKLIAQASSSLTIGNTAQNMVLGRTSDTDSNMFDGSIAHVAIWDTALVGNEIFALSQGISPFQVRPQNLRGYWSLNDYGASGQARDLSPFNTTLTMTGAVPLADDPKQASRFSVYLPFDSQQGLINYTDTAVVYLNLTNVGGECFSTWSGSFLGEGEADLRWATASDLTRWLGTSELRWSTGEVSVEGVHC